MKTYHHFLGTPDRGLTIRLRWMEYYQLTHNVTGTARHFGISRGTFYRWVKRYEKYGEKGLAELSRRPHKINWQIPQQIVDLILQIRYQRGYGHQRMSLYLRKRHNVFVSSTTILRIFKRYQIPMGRKRKKWLRYPQKYSKATPGERLQVDVKFVPKMSDEKKRYYQFTAIDDCTRFRVLKIYDQNTEQSAMDFVNHVKQALPFAIKQIQTDNGSEFASTFTWHLADLDIEHRKIRPGTPEENGKVERSHKTDQQEFYERQIFGDVKTLIRHMREWEHEYNYYRPNMALGGLTPYEYLQKKLPVYQKLAINQSVMEVG